MKGEVVGIRNDKCAVRIDSGITVFAILYEHSTEIGDIISGNLESLGSETLVNETKKERLDVFIDDLECSPLSSDQWLRS